MTLLYGIDMAGTFVFGISGALAASEKKFDLFGVSCIAFVTAVGGGTLRDILIDSHPLTWIQDMMYLLVVLAGVIVTFLFKKRIMPLRKTMFLFDTIGIAVFTIGGVEKALSLGYNPLIAIILGMMSAVFGGVIRDILCNDEPLLFRSEIYATACMTGALTYVLMDMVVPQREVVFICSAIVIAVFRGLAVKYKLGLPKIK